MTGIDRFENGPSESHPMSQESKLRSDMESKETCEGSQWKSDFDFC